MVGSMTRSRRWALPAALGLASACLLAPAAAYSPAADEPIKLATEDEEPPTVEPGLHQVELPSGSESQFLRVRREIPGSTIWVGQALVSEGVENGYVGLSVRDGSDQCPYVDFDGSDYEGHKLVTGGINVAPRCSSGNTVDISQQPTSGFPLGGQLADLVVWEEPPVENRSVLPPPATQIAWDDEGVPAEGETELGGTYADAPELADGKYDVHVDPAEPALFRVELDWNQHLQLGFSITGKPAGSALLTPVLINPVGAESEWATVTDGPTLTSVMTTYPNSEAGVASPSITWRNRESRGVTAAFPGTYYVSLKLGEKDAPPSGADLSLSVKVITDKEPQSPYTAEYRDSAEAVATDIGGHTESPEAESDSDSSESSGSAGDSGSTPWGAVGGLFAGAVVMALAGGFSWTRYRRSLA